MAAESQHRSKRARVARNGKCPQSPGPYLVHSRECDSIANVLSGGDGHRAGKALKALYTFVNPKDDRSVEKIIITHKAALTNASTHGRIHEQAAVEEKDLVAKIIRAHNGATIYDPADPIYKPVDASNQSKKRIAGGEYCPEFWLQRVMVAQEISDDTDNICDVVVSERKLYDPASFDVRRFNGIFVEHPDSDIKASFHQDEHEPTERINTAQGLTRYERLLVKVIVELL